MDGPPSSGDQHDGTSTQASNWRSQVEREIFCLERDGEDPVSDVQQALDRVLRLEDALVPDPDLNIDVAYVQPKLAAAMHPSAFDQVSITAIAALARRVSSGPIRIFASLRNGDVAITVTGVLRTEGIPTEHDLLKDFLVPPSASVEIDFDGGHVFLRIGMPSVSKITVLAVEDNADMVRFFRRSVGGTRYRIIHVDEGKEVFRIIEATSPDVIVMDIMLPDVDGWHLLMRLHEDPVTKSIPVIVCSVVREERLALSLGAALYLAKPVRPRQFTEALDQVLTQA
jgi:CheY-like chemotaxis protein